MRSQNYHSSSVPKYGICNSNSCNSHASSSTMSRSVVVSNQSSFEADILSVLRTTFVRLNKLCHPSPFLEQNWCYIVGTCFCVGQLVICSMRGNWGSLDVVYYSIPGQPDRWIPILMKVGISTSTWFRVVPICSLISEQFFFRSRMIFYAVCNFLRFRGKFTLGRLKKAEKPLSSGQTLILSSGM